jgi:hypothetical protein
MLPDLAAPKVAVPATLFMISQVSESTHGLSFLLVPLLSWIIIKYVLKNNVTKADIIVPGILTILLELVHLPLEAPTAIVCKGLVFLVVFSYLRILFPAYY